MPGICRVFGPCLLPEKKGKHIEKSPENPYLKGSKNNIVNHHSWDLIPLENGFLMFPENTKAALYTLSEVLFTGKIYQNLAQNLAVSTVPPHNPLKKAEGLILEVHLQNRGRSDGKAVAKVLASNFLGQAAVTMGLLLDPDAVPSSLTSSTASLSATNPQPFGRL